LLPVSLATYSIERAMGAVLWSRAERWSRWDQP
jgi:hypothetical protein